MSHTYAFQPPLRTLLTTRATYQIYADDLAVGLLDLPQLHQKVPKPRLRDHRVWCEYAHAVELGCRVGIRWQMTPDDLVFIEAP